ncbi:hypothetical protein IMZ48_19140, partial [Candidatus Bathyarchaeota archaeon]|nr:hypothetical protein [Candidatus Bathyarchaeota archaeon]
MEHIAYIERDAPALQSRIAFWPGWRPCPYLPLTADGSYISGLTAYMDFESGGITGWA